MSYVCLRPGRGRASPPSLSPCHVERPWPSWTNAHCASSGPWPSVTPQLPSSRASRSASCKTVCHLSVGRDPFRSGRCSGHSRYLLPLPTLARLCLLPGRTRHSGSYGAGQQASGEDHWILHTWPVSPGQGQPGRPTRQHWALRWPLLALLLPLRHPPHISSLVSYRKAFANRNDNQKGPRSRPAQFPSSSPRRRTWLGRQLGRRRVELTGPPRGRVPEGQRLTPELLSPVCHTAIRDMTRSSRRRPAVIGVSSNRRHDRGAPCRLSSCSPAVHHSSLRHVATCPAVTRPGRSRPCFVYARACLRGRVDDRSRVGPCALPTPLLRWPLLGGIPCRLLSSVVIGSCV